VFEGQPATIRLASHVTTTIRLPEPINSVVVGDSNLFQPEYSPNEPLLVFVRATASDFVQTNLVISTVQGRQFILILKNLGPLRDELDSAVDLLVICQGSGLHFIEETLPSAVISETVGVGTVIQPPTVVDGNSPTTGKSDTGLALDEILNQQRRQTIEKLYGDHIRVGIGQIIENGSRLIVPFSVTNSKPETIDLVPPQVQLASQSKAGMFGHRRWTSGQQVSVEAYQWTERKLRAGARADGVVVFERPAVMQSTEGLYLQIADSAAIDQPTLAPIHFRQTKPMEDDDE
jgi:hypothetical protein